MKYKVLKIFSYIFIAVSAFNAVSLKPLDLITCPVCIAAAILEIRFANGKKNPKCALWIALAVTVLFTASIAYGVRDVGESEVKTVAVGAESSDSGSSDEGDPALRKPGVIVSIPFMLAPAFLYMAAFREAWKNEQ